MGASAFRLCGYAGIVLAGMLANGLAIYGGLSPGVLLAVTPVAIIIFFALAMATKIGVSDERLVYYHHEIAVFSGVALFLRSLHEPVLPYLDITVLGLGVFLACGRIGCLLVGCCHGRPYRWGVCYGHEHAARGFTPYYVGITLFPVQALESIWVLGIVVIGTWMVIHGSAAGAVLALYVVFYGLGRFWFEFLRGDPDRPYFYGFSEAQWTSLILISLIVCGDAFHTLPFRAWHLQAAMFVGAAMIAIALHRRFRRTPTHRLFNPRHIREIAEAITFANARQLKQTDTAPPNGTEIRLGRTSLGVRISAGEVQSCGVICSHYAVSYENGRMSADFARELAKVICVLRRPNPGFELVPGNRGVFHLLIRAAEQRPSTVVSPVFLSRIRQEGSMMRYPKHPSGTP